MLKLSTVGCETIGDCRMMILKSGENIYISDFNVSQLHNVILNNLRKKSEKAVENLKEKRDYLILDKEDIKANKIVLRGCGATNIALDRTNTVYLYSLAAYMEIINSIKNDSVNKYSGEVLERIFGVESEEEQEEFIELKADITIDGEYNTLAEITIPRIRGGFGPNEMILSEVQVAELHDKKMFHIREAIKKIGNKLIQGVDYIDLIRYQDRDALLSELGYTKNNLTAKHFYIFSERGYLKLVKHFNDDRSWSVFEDLLDNYFKLIINQNMVVPESNKRAEALLQAIEGKTIEERTVGLQLYVEAIREEDKKTIEEQQAIIDIVVPRDALYPIGLVGRILKTYNSKEFGPVKLFEFMREKGLLIDSRNKEIRNTPKHHVAKHFEVKLSSFTKDDNSTKVVPKTYFTTEGIEWFLKKIAREGYINKSEISTIETILKESIEKGE